MCSLSSKSRWHKFGLVHWSSILTNHPIWWITSHLFLEPTSPSPSHPFFSFSFHHFLPFLILLLSPFFLSYLFCSSPPDPLLLLCSISIFQVSYTASDITLSDKRRFPNFLRIIPSDTPAIISVTSVVREFRWDQVAIVTQIDNLFTNVGGSFNVWFFHNCSPFASRSFFVPFPLLSPFPIVASPPFQ